VQLINKVSILRDYVSKFYYGLLYNYIENYERIIYIYLKHESCANCVQLYVVLHKKSIRHFIV